MCARYSQMSNKGASIFGGAYTTETLNKDL